MNTKGFKALLIVHLIPLATKHVEVAWFDVYIYKLLEHYVSQGKSKTFGLYRTSEVCSLWNKLQNGTSDR